MEKKFKIHTRILENIGNLLRSPEFIASHRVGPSDFTRKRRLSVDILVAFLLQMVGGSSLQVGLDQFFCALGGGVTLARVVTKSAFSQARKKLRPSALAALGALPVREWCGNGAGMAGGGGRAPMARLAGRVVAQSTEIKVFQLKCAMVS